MINDMEVLNNNKIFIAGAIHKEPVFNHLMYGESFYTTYVEVSRLSNQTDIIPVLVSGHLIDVEELKIGVKVKIDGQVRSYNNQEGSHRKKLIINVFAREIQIVEDFNDLDNLNDVFFDGFICRQPNFRTTPFGREICDLLVAINRAYKKSDYIPCITWGRNAKYCEKMEVGTNIRIWGRFQSRDYEKKDRFGNVTQKTAYEVSVIKLEKIAEEE